jgi:hypothetical protein
MTAITTSPWLGTRKDQWSHEIFPEGMLNQHQLRTLLEVEEGGRRVIELDYVARPAILKITDEITEVHVRFGHPRERHTAEPTYFWFNTDGRYLAAVIEKYEGPQGVHPPGAKFRKWAVAYLRTPSMSNFDKAEEVTYEAMWTLSHNGAVDQVRQFIRDNWIES